jgi:uncharacterized membrane protein
MKKIFNILIFTMIVFFLTGCNSQEKLTDQTSSNFISVEANNYGKIIIDTKNITSEATFVNYEVDGVIIQFVVVRGTDDIVRIAFNTCQACNPSPNAYFIQDGEYLQCQNCGNKFHIDQIGVEKGGCNPAPVEEKEEKENQIIIDKEYVESYKSKFENWNGPTK